MQPILTCTIARDGRSDQFGRPLAASSTYTGPAELVRELVKQGFATVASPDVFRDDSSATFGHVVALAQSHVQITAPNDTNENTLWSVVIPGGLMGPNDTLRITARGSCTSSANNKTLRLRVGGTAMGQVQATNTVSVPLNAGFSNRNSQSSQIGGLNTAVAGSTYVALTSAVNTAQPFAIAITGQLALGTESLTLESVLVELIPGVS